MFINDDDDDDDDDDDVQSFPKPALARGLGEREVTAYVSRGQDHCRACAQLGFRHVRV